MPDDYATDDWVATTKGWVEENPALALLAATGIGLLAGRVVGALFSDPEPSLADRVETRAKSVRKDLKKEAKRRRKDIKKAQKRAKKRGEVYKKDAAAFAHDAGESFEDFLQKASASIRDAAHSAGDVAEEGVEKTKDLADTLADAAKVAVAGVVAAKIEDWVERARK
jgi:flagellar hook-basal body complex protein FliE